MGVRKGAHVTAFFYGKEGFPMDSMNSMVATDEQKERDQGLSLRFFLDVLRISWIFMVIGAILFGAVGVAYTMSLKPSYSSSALCTLTVSMDDIFDEESQKVTSTTGAELSISKVYRQVYIQELRNSNTAARAIWLWLVTKYGWGSGEEEAAKPLYSPGAVKGMYSVMTPTEEGYSMFLVRASSVDAQATDDVINAVCDVITGNWQRNDTYLSLFLFGFGGLKSVDEYEGSDDAAKALAFKRAFVERLTTVAGGDPVEPTDQEVEMLFARFCAEGNANTELNFTEAKLLNASRELPRIQSACANVGLSEADTAWAYELAYIDGTAIFARDIDVAPSKAATSKMYVFLALAIGALLPYAYFFLRRLFDTRIVTEDDLLRVSDYPLLAKIPAIHSTHKEGTK